jgi:drug/metabolite transporter (DMT)-like permease
MEVPIATLIAVAFLGERLAWPQVVGMICVLTAAILPGAHAELSAQRRAQAASSLAPIPD